MARQCVKSLTCLTSTTYGIDTIIIPISQTWKLRHKDELTCQVPMTGWWNQVYDCWCNSHRAMPFISRELASPRIKITEPRDNCDLLLSHSFYRRRKAETHPGSPRAGPRNQVSFFLSECWSYCVLLYRGPSAAEGLLKIHIAFFQRLWLPIQEHFLVFFERWPQYRLTVSGEPSSSVIVKNGSSALTKE